MVKSQDLGKTVPVFILILTILFVDNAASINPTCRNESLYISYNKTVQRINDDIYCLNRTNTNENADNLCQHDSENLTFALSDVELTYISLVDTENISCIQLNKLDLPVKETCINISAETTADPRNRSENPAVICIVFNREGPVIIPNLSFRINVAATDKVKNVSVLLSSVDGISDIIIPGIETSNSQINFTDLIKVKSFDPAVFEIHSPNQLLSDQDIIVNFQATDDGNPKISENGSFLIQYFNDTITCSDLMFKVDLKSLATIKNTSIGELDCQSTAGNITYSIVQATDLIVGVENESEVIFYNTTIDQPSNKSLILNVTSSTGSYKTFTLWVILGNSPSFQNSPYRLTLNETTAVETCFNVVDISHVGTLTSNTDKFEFTHGNTSICVTESLISNSRSDYNITGDLNVSNDFGMDSSQLFVEVKTVLIPPIINITKSNVYVKDNTPSGTIVLTIQVIPNDAELTIVRRDGSVSPPFSLNKQSGDGGLWELKLDSDVTGKADTTYQINLQATSTIGDKSNESVSIFIIDDTVPVCTSYDIPRDLPIDSSVDTLITTLQCNDSDGDDINYTFTSDTPQYIQDHFSLSSNSVELTVKLKRELSDLTLEQLKNLEFRIRIGDTNKSVNATIRLTITVPNPPVCNGEIPITITETTNPGSCQDLQTSCSTTYNLNLTYSLVDNAYLSSGIQTKNSGKIEICTNSTSQSFPAGSYSISALVSDGFQNVTTSVNLTIEAVNQFSPVFDSVVNGMDTIFVNETKQQGKPIYSFTVTDQDGGDFGQFNVEAFDLGLAFSMNSTGNVYTIFHNHPLNSADFLSKNVSFVATDTGGRSSNLNLTINIIDINEAPVCQIIRIFNVSVLTATGTTIGELDCMDNDTKTEYKQIQYSIVQRTPNTVPFRVGVNGSINVIESLLNQPSVIDFVVSASSLDLTTYINITVNIERNFPPVCNTTNLQTVFLETTTRCNQEKIRCNSSVDTTFTWTIFNNRTNDLRVNVDNTTAGILDIRMCLPHQIRRNIFMDTVRIEVGNGLGSETINWAVEVKDVNEAPRFENDTYDIDVLETTANGTNIAMIDFVRAFIDTSADPLHVIQLLDPDIEDKFRVKNIHGSAILIDKLSNQEVPSLTIPIQYANQDFDIIRPLDPRYIVEFTIQASDGGNLNASAIVNFKIKDVNEKPSCTTYDVALSIIRSTTADDFLTVQCNDTDVDPNFKNLQYSIITQPYPDVFKVRTSGAMYLGKRLPRETGQHIVTIQARDNGTPPLSSTATVTINVNRDVSAVCNPVVTPPQVWLKDECTTIDSGCTDPTTDPGDTSTLTYVSTGDYIPDFYVYNSTFDGSNGILRLCYNRSVNGDYQASIRVNNGFKNITLPFNISVLYLQSVPVFSQQRYTTTTREDIAIGTKIIAVHAESAGNFSGNVTYSIKGENLAGFEIDENGTLITTSSLKRFSNEEIILTVEAEDDRSRLASSVTVTIDVTDINEKPVCSDDRSVKVTVDASVSVGYVVYRFNCTDSDRNPKFDQLTPNLNGSTYFRLSPGTQNIETKSQLPVTSSPTYLTFSVTDGLLTTIIDVTVNISFQPSVPKLTVSELGIYNVELCWSYDRPESQNLVLRHILEVTYSRTDIRYIKLDRSNTSYNVTDLKAANLYQFRIIAETNNNNLTSLKEFVTTLEIPILTTVLVGFRVTNRDWNNIMVNNKSQAYIDLKREVETNLTVGLSEDKGLHKTEVINMRPGSVIFDAVFFVNQTGTVNETIANFRDSIYTGAVGTLITDTRSGVAYRGAQYISTPTLHLEAGDPNHLKEGIIITYACTFRMVSLSGNTGVKVEWFIDDSPLILSHTSRIQLANFPVTNDRFGYLYTLTFNKTAPSHTGSLKCEITSVENSSVTISASTNVNIISKPVVTLWPLTVFLNGGGTVTLRCTSVLASSAPVTYSWFNINTNSIVANENTDTLSVTVQNSDSEYYCIVSNAAGQTNSLTAAIHYVPPNDDRPCSEITDIRNTTWPSAHRDADVKLECGPGYDGLARRHCSSSGMWLQPDYSNCKKTNLVILKRKTEDVKEGKVVEVPEDTLKTLVNLTVEARRFSAGDVETTIQILLDIIDINNDNESKVIEKPELENFAKSASNILDADDEEWSTLSEQNKSGLAAMLGTVDDMAKLTSSRLRTRTPITAVTTKIVIEVGRTSLSDIEFPRMSATDYPSWVSQSKNQVFLPKGALAAHFEDDTEVGYNAVFYNDVTTILEDMVLQQGGTDNMYNISGFDINSKVLAFSVDMLHEKKLNPPITLTFQHMAENYSNPQCVFLNLRPPYENVGRWSSEGCIAESSPDSNVTICKCDHLTNFAILMSPGKTPLHHQEALSIISIVGCAVSLFCLLLTICIYIYLWRYVKSDKAIILMNLCVTLIISYVLFIGGVNQTENKDVCTAVSALLHFFYLVVFFLMLAEGVEVFISVVYVFATKSRLKWIMLGSWGFPALIVGISLGVTQLEGYGNKHFCWLSLESGLLWAFVGPAIFVIVVNMCIMIKVLTVMFSTTTMVTKTMKEKGRTGIKALCVLLPIMGLTWVFGVFSVNEDLVTFQYLFAIFNSLQGLFIFIFHCLMCRQVKDGFKIKRRRYRAKSVDTTKSFTQVPLHNQSRSTSETNDKPTNDLDKKTSPFNEIDRQVQQLALAQKLAKVDNNNIKANQRKDNIAPDDKVINQSRTIFDDIPIESEPEPVVQEPKTFEDMYVSVKDIDLRKTMEREKRDFPNKPTNASKGFSSSDHSSRKREEPGPRPVSQHTYDKLSPRDVGIPHDYTRLDKSKTRPGYDPFVNSTQALPRKMPSIEDNSKQQGYYPSSSDYLPQTVPALNRDLSPPRRQEYSKPPAVAPKSKPRRDEEDDNGGNAYDAVDAYYIGPKTKPSKVQEYPAKSKKKSSSNPNLSQQPTYPEQYPPTDKWAKLKENKMKVQQPYREGPMYDSRQRMQSHDDLSAYKSHVYQPFVGVQAARGRPQPRPEQRYDMGWQEPRSNYR
ncbi:uncharacterized protein LOC126812386 [Patella vulgata]|uniref:uncharacterized protein LOC126812386 n=1 Tax=Patella vulgata TaxID=6465 RepID=UPI0024A7EB12|nr:uncharacterized protein LOC126812386 [Patella vulgata]